MLREIHLYGNLATDYAPKLVLDVDSVVEAIFALEANFPGFTDKIRTMNLHVVKGVKVAKEAFDFGKNKISLAMKFYDNEPFHIMPAIEGAGDDGDAG